MVNLLALFVTSNIYASRTYLYYFISIKKENLYNPRLTLETIYKIYLLIIKFLNIIYKFKYLKNNSISLKTLKRVLNIIWDIKKK